MNKVITSLLLLVVVGSAGAAPQTQLSEKVRVMPDGLYRSDVLKLLGKPSHAYIPRDFKEQSVDGDPNLAYILVWKNSPCSNVEIWFDHRNKVTGSDGGTSCEGKQSPPKAKYSCDTSTRASFCK